MLKKRFLFSFVSVAIVKKVKENAIFLYLNI